MKNILLVIDKEGWALETIANEIKKNLKNKYNFTIITPEIFGYDIVKVFIYSSKFDLTFFLWRGLIYWLLSENSKINIEKLGFSFEEFIYKFFDSNKIISNVCDHLFLNDSEMYITDFIFKHVKYYSVSSKKLLDIYSNFSGINKPTLEINDGVDLKKFCIEKDKKFSKNDEPLVIGWAGNSKFQDETDDDLKGVNRIIHPAIIELKNEGYNIKLKIADRNIKKIPHNEMPKYYNTLDLYICTSRTEGSPLTILEAMACGVPFISTDVGIVREASGKMQSNFIINRTKEELKAKIKYLYNNRDVLLKLSNENLERIKKYDWKFVADNYEKLFDIAIKGE